MFQSHFRNSLWGVDLFIVCAQSLNACFRCAPILSGGDGTLGTKYRLRSDWRKPQEGLTFSRANYAKIIQSRNRTKSYFHDFTWCAVGLCDCVLDRVEEFNFYAAAA